MSTKILALLNSKYQQFSRKSRPLLFQGEHNQECRKKFVSYYDKNKNTKKENKLTNQNQLFLAHY